MTIEELIEVNNEDMMTLGQCKMPVVLKTLRAADRIVRGCLELEGAQARDDMLLRFILYLRGTPDKNKVFGVLYKKAAQIYDACEEGKILVWTQYLSAWINAVFNEMDTKKVRAK